ncbi:MULTISPECIES: lipopolysaccharide biosynthesis protein [Acinetobacter]|uniref:Lipopolysaccharide biosynthesis protein n=1 Tax=Acinetobacter corruptisaponis TaxID=3045147 RepID=A0ABY8RZ45_9GAMM|nr:lipopolysaccharide biosynthesis protein [Acinetobacter sp. KCTC 92772]WHP04490.1 lipopolysaccharide biosynthesis protein [Acinetobacter sp. KCTC 92772]
MKELEHLKGKKILFFCVQTFDLEKGIVQQLEKHGAQVTYFDERPKNNNFTKGIIRLKRDLLEKKIQKYYDSILEQIQAERFDFLLVNRGEVVPSSFLERFIKLQPECIRIFYTWDSFHNHSHGLEILKYFQKRFTFDQKDAEEYNIGFRPLYFTDKYKDICSNNTEIDIDLLFLGTAHSDRYVISSKIAEWCVSNDLISFNYYYMQGKFVYFYKKFFDKTFYKFDYKKLSFKGLNLDQIIDFYKKSNVILDISHPGQTGLTMRTFEALGAGKKLITTNTNIIGYPFYNPNNIFVIDRKNIKLDKEFFLNDYEPLTQNLYEKCSIHGWLVDIFLRNEIDDWSK